MVGWTWAVCVSTLLTFTVSTGKYILGVLQGYPKFRLPVSLEEIVERIKDYEFTLHMRHNVGDIRKQVFPFFSAYLLA